MKYFNVEVYQNTPENRKTDELPQRVLLHGPNKEAAILAAFVSTIANPEHDSRPLNRILELALLYCRAIEMPTPKGS